MAMLPLTTGFQQSLQLQKKKVLITRFIKVLAYVPLLGTSCLLGIGECLPLIVGGCGSALRTLTFLPPLVTTLVMAGACLFLALDLL